MIKEVIGTDVFRCTVPTTEGEVSFIIGPKELIALHTESQLVLDEFFARRRLAFDWEKERREYELSPTTTHAIAAN